MNFRPTLEPLEDRNLMAVTLSGGVLTVDNHGDAAPHNVKVELAPGGLKVTDNGTASGPYGGVTRVVVRCGDGGDTVQAAAGRTNVPAEVYGGAGDDVLTGGFGNDVIDGGGGANVVTGGGGVNLLVGGAGASTVKAGGPGSVILGGVFDPAADFATRQAGLQAVLAAWASADSYPSRVAAVTALMNGKAHDNGQVDTLSGLNGQNLYFAALSGVAVDSLPDRGPGEAAVDIAGQ